MFKRSVETVWDFAQAKVGDGIRPEAPAGFTEKINAGMNFAMYISIAVAIIGVIVAGATMVISRREGSSEEATALALRIGFGCMIIGSAVTVVNWLVT